MVGMPRGCTDYVSYLLRLWRTSEREDTAWRGSLESPSTGQRWGFGNLESLVEFLKEQIGTSMRDPICQSADGDGPEGHPGPFCRGDPVERA